MHQKICKTCNKEFETNRSHTKFCSRLCHRRFPTNKVKYSKRVSDYQKKHSREPERRYNKLLHKCNHKQYEFNIELTDYITLINSNCTYCGSELTRESGCGLDRIDNSGGYTISNVVPCCGSCNQIRNVHLSYEEMIIAMRAVLRYRNNL